jgi:hypothetical protein
MKLGKRFKSIFLWSTAVLYITGVSVWILEHYFKIDTGYGFEPPALKAWALHAHSIVSFLFFVLFGYLYRAHIEPGLKKRKKKFSGLLLAGSLTLLFLTVPMMFYMTGASTRAWVGFIHTWLGAVLLAPFLIHLRPKPARASTDK